MVHHVDRHVGARIRMRRLSMAMSQQALARKLGITLQQVQKYELGRNRVSASRLWEIAQALQVDIGHFFEGLARPPRAPRLRAPVVPAPCCTSRPGTALQRGDLRLPDPPPDRPVSHHAARLLRRFAAIPAPKRARLLDLARTLTEN